MSDDAKAVLDIIERVSKSVVNISTVKLVHNIFYQAVAVGGIGSGTIIDEKGLILTNNHVIGGAQKINVTLGSNEIMEGIIAGSCAIHDIAVVKINGSKSDLQAAQLGDSDKIRVGQKVYVTSGVISALNRTIESDRGLIENLVQTDASINPGNSGGPLVDVTGKVIPINTAIIPFAQGIGFAIPINSAKSCTDEIVTESGVKRPWIGIVGLTLTREISRYYNLPVNRGVLVTRISEGSPAEVAGIAEGDMILEINNVETNRIEDLVSEIKKRNSGDIVKILALRNGGQQMFRIKLSEAP